MADKNETFEFQIKANIKQLQESLKQIPSMTKEEAQKMVRALSSEMRKAQTAAKKAAEESKKAARIAAKEFKKSGEQVKETFDEQAKAAQIAGAKMQKAMQPASGLKATRKQSRDLGAAFGSLEDVVGGINPQLADMANQIGIVGQGMRSLSRSLATGNVVLIGIVGTLAAVAVGYTLFTIKQQKAREAFDKFQESLKTGDQSLKEIGKEVDELSRKLENAIPDPEIARVKALQEEGVLTRELLVLRGKMTSTQKTIIDRNSKLKSDLKEQNEIAELVSSNIMIRAIEARKEIGFLERNIKLQKELIKNANLDVIKKKEAGDLLFEMKQRRLELKRLVATEKKDQEKLNKDLEVRTESLKKQAAIQNQITIEREKQEKMKSFIDVSFQNVDLSIGSKIGQMLGKEISDGLKESAKISEVLQKEIGKAEQKNVQLAIQNRRTKISLIDDEDKRIKATLELEKQLMNAQISKIRAQQIANLENASTQEQQQLALEANANLETQIELLKEENHLNEMKRSEARIKSNEKEQKSRIALAQSILGTFATGARATGELIKTVSKENEEATMIAFRLNQSAALADIAMNTAVQISKVAGNPFAIAAILGVAGVQTANVLAQSPPEMHMGGMITKGEDTRDITVLTGEAVLNRRTVQNLGGEEGINRIQRTGELPSQEVIVMNPFKHFDRYARASIKRGGYLSKASKKSASGGY